MFKYPNAIADYEAALKINPNDGDTRERLRFAQAKLAPSRPPPKAPVATPTPVPKPFRMPPAGWAAIGALALIVIILIATLIVRRKTRGY